MKLISSILISILLVIFQSACQPASDAVGDTLSEGQTYYVDSWTGDDSNNGFSPEAAWKTLAKASSRTYGPGEALLLCKGRSFEGQLVLKLEGNEEAPVRISSYDSAVGSDAPPVIQAAGYPACIEIENGKHFIISDLELTADAGETEIERARTHRYGILMMATGNGASSHARFLNLNIHDIFATQNSESDGQNPTSNLGYGMGIFLRSPKASISDIHIEGCNITRTGHTGIRLTGIANEAGESVFIENVTILNNYLKEIGGPGIVPARCRNVLVRGNVTDDTGSAVDPRMHNRGSGIWPWTCHDVLIEKNRFMHAFGIHDSHGAHIDFNCKNVVVQYNLSINNHGGFVEILGNNDNCSYRYNISINDGWRIEGKLGAKAEGNALWFSGYTGRDNPRIGPRNSYIYNNTVYVKADQRTCMSVISNTDGAFIANNIFYLLGPVEDDSDHVMDPATGQPTSPQRVVFENNLYARVDTVPKELTIQDSNPIIGNPGFSNPGGFEAEDYIPTNVKLIKDRGIVPAKIPGDPVGLTIGLEVEKDFLGNPIQGVPDIGAIEMP